MTEITEIHRIDASSASVDDDWAAIDGDVTDAADASAAAVLATTLTWNMVQDAARAICIGVNEATHPTYHVAASSTEVREQSVAFRRLVEDVLKRGRSQWFQDSMESQLSKEIAELLHDNAADLIVTLASFLSGNRFNPEVLAEALHTVGRHFPEQEHQAALWLLEHGLGSVAPYVRDAAALALVQAGDDASVESLRTAVERESIPSLRRDLIQALEELARNRDDASARHE